MPKYTDYIVVKTFDIEEKLRELEWVIQNSNKFDPMTVSEARNEERILNNILANSKLLSPLIEEGFEAGGNEGFNQYDEEKWRNVKEQYLNRKIEI